MKQHVRPVQQVTRHCSHQLPPVSDTAAALYGLGFLGCMQVRGNRGLHINLPSTPASITMYVLVEGSEGGCSGSIRPIIMLVQWEGINYLSLCGPCRSCFCATLSLFVAVCRAERCRDLWTSSHFCCCQAAKAAAQQRLAVWSAHSSVLVRPGPEHVPPVPSPWLSGYVCSSRRGHVCATSTSKANSSTCIFYLLLLSVSRARMCGVVGTVLQWLSYLVLWSGCMVSV